MTKSSSTGRALRAVSTLALLASAAIGPSCNSPGGEKIDDHWTFDSVPPRAARALLGYDASRESSYKDFAWDRKKSISLTLRRYLFNHNPMNPNQAPQESLYAPRPVNSILPNPVNYIHVEGFLIGWPDGRPDPDPGGLHLGTPSREAPRSSSKASSSPPEDGRQLRQPSAALYGEDGALPTFEMTENARRRRS